MAGELHGRAAWHTPRKLEAGCLSECCMAWHTVRKLASSCEALAWTHPLPPNTSGSCSPQPAHHMHSPAPTRTHPPAPTSTHLAAGQEHDARHSGRHAAPHHTQRLVGNHVLQSVGETRGAAQSTVACNMQSSASLQLMDAIWGEPLITGCTASSGSVHGNTAGVHEISPRWASPRCGRPRGCTSAA